MLPLLVLLAATPAPRPAPPVLEPAEAPPQELEPLAVFEGAWTCETIHGPKERPAYDLIVERDLGGFWFAGRWVERTPDGTSPHTRLFFWSHDAVLGKFVGGWLDSRGGWSAQTSMGWEGDARDRLVFLGHVTATGEKVSARETFTRPRGDEFVRRYEVLGFVEWSLLTEERCRRK